jgi:hypothetical protein
MLQVYLKIPKEIYGLEQIGKGIARYDGKN